MTDTTTGAALPCWYELSTNDAEAASSFYSSALGWQIANAGMEGFDYRIASDPEGNGVAGISSFLPEGAPGPFWNFYVEVDDCDAKAQQATSAGAHVLVPPSDIPGTGRFSVIADPQGAVFGILQPLPMEQPSGTRAYDPHRVGHGCWHELSTTDPEAGFAFYSGLFGWQKSSAMDMGEHGTYQLFSANGDDLGGMMGDMGRGHSAWLSYINVPTVNGAIEKAKAAGGSLVHGPNEVPGGAWVAIIADAKGAAIGISAATLD